MEAISDTSTNREWEAFGMCDEAIHQRQIATTEHDNVENQAVPVTQEHE
jgi:hypothetical protein